MKHLKKVGVALACLALLSGCGGGGGGGGTGGDSIPVSAQGFWSGSNGVGEDFLMAVLPSGETWFVGTRNERLSYIIQGASSAVNGGQFTVNNARRVVLDPAWASTASFLTGTLNSADRLTVNGTALSFDTSYNTPLTFMDVADSYSTSGVSRFGQSPNATVTISAGGEVSATNLGGNCTAAGTLTATGKGVMSLSLTFNGSACSMGNGTTTRGIVVYDAEDRMFTAFSFNADLSDGFIAVGERR